MFGVSSGVARVLTTVVAVVVAGLAVPGAAQAAERPEASQRPVIVTSLCAFGKVVKAPKNSSGRCGRNETMVPIKVFTVLCLADSVTTHKARACARRGGTVTKLPARQRLVLCSDVFTRAVWPLMGETCGRNTQRFAIRDTRPSSPALVGSVVAENEPPGTEVGRLTAVDPDNGDNLTYQLVPGRADNVNFTLDGDRLLTAVPFNYEVNSALTVRFRVTDRVGKRVFGRATIQVSDVDEGVMLDATSHPENDSSPVGTLSVSEPHAVAPITYDLVAGVGDSDNDRFTISGDQLIPVQSLDHETTPQVSVRVRATDASAQVWTASLTIVVTDVNEAPESIQLSGATIAENSPAGTLIGTLSAIDQDGDPITFSVAPSSESDVAIIDNAVLGARVFDFETEPTINVEVIATDPHGASTTATLAFSVIDVGITAPIALSEASVAENCACVVGTLSLMDPEITVPISYSLALGEGSGDNQQFSIVDDQLSVAAQDFEARDTLRVRVRATDGAGSWVEQPLTITVTDVNDAPTGPVLSGGSIVENAPVGTEIGELSSTDQDGDAITFSVAPASTGDVSLVGEVLVSARAFDFETEPEISVQVIATDSHGASTMATVQFDVTDVAAIDGLTLDNTSVAENCAGCVVGTLSIDGPEVVTPVTYTLADGDGDDDNDQFMIVGSSLRVASLLDFETSSQLQVRVRATGADELWVEQTWTISVTDVNEAPIATPVTLTGATGNTVAILGAVSHDGPATVLTGAPLLSGASDPDGDPVSLVPAASITTALGGQVSLQGDGSLAYWPPVGSGGTDHVDLPITDGALTGTVRVNLPISGRIWWVDDDADWGSAAGTSWAPFTSVAAADTVDAADDTVFVYAGNYLGGITLSANESLIGEGVGLPGLVEAGTAPVISSAVMSLVDLAPGARVAGVTLSPTGSATAIRGVGASGAVVADTVSIDAGTAADVINLAGVASPAVQIGASITQTGSGAVVNNASSATFTGTITSTGSVISSGTSSFAGRLALTTGTRVGVSSTAGALTMTASDNSVRTTTGVALQLANTTIGADGVSVAHLSSTSAVNGIALSNLSGPGAVSIGDPSLGATSQCGGTSSGAGSTISVANSEECSTGRINNSTSDGVVLTNVTTPVTLRNLWISNSQHHGVSATASALTVERSLIQSNGDAADEHGIWLNNPVAASVDTATVSYSGDGGIVAKQSSGSGTVEVLGVQVIGSAGSLGARDGVRVEAIGSAVVTAAIKQSRFTGPFSDHVQVTSTGASTVIADVMANTLVGSASTGVVVAASASTWTGKVDAEISGNTVLGASGSAIVASQTNAGASGVFDIDILDNTIGNSTALSCSGTGFDGIYLDSEGSSNTIRTTIAGNTVTNCGGRGISVSAGAGATAAVSATLTSNVVTSPGAYGLFFDVGLVASDAGSSCLDMRSNTFTGAAGFEGARVRKRYADLAVVGNTGTTHVAVSTALTSLNAPSTVLVDPATAGSFTPATSCQ